MSAIKEYREFFLRNVQVNTGSKSDQEVGFITSYFVNGITKFNRFLKGHFPSQDVMNKFVTSITFKLNQEDTAKLGEQGLSKIAADADAESRTSNIISDYTATVVPHQLPEVIGTIAGTDTVVSTDQFHGIEITTLKRTISGKFRRIYKLAIALGSGSLAFDGDDLILENDEGSPGANKNYGTNASGVRGWYSKAITAIRTSTVNFGAGFALAVANGQTVPGCSAVATVAGTYLAIMEADLVSRDVDAVTITYRLMNGVTALNDDRRIFTQLQGSDYMNSKMMCTAYPCVLAQGDTVTLNVDSTHVRTIFGRSITLIKLS